MKAGFVGCIGNNQFGIFLKELLNRCNIDDTYLKVDDQVNTTLAFVHLQENGDRDFSFYRNPGADQMITEEDMETVDFDDVKVFHFGSLSLTDEPSRSATLMGIKISFPKILVEQCVSEKLTVVRLCVIALLIRKGSNIKNSRR